jgi:hypothetical protein
VLFLLRIALAIWGLSSFYMNFKVFFFFLYFCEACHWNLIGDCIGSVDHFCHVDILTILILPALTHGGSLNLLASSIISSVLQFSLGGL